MPPRPRKKTPAAAAPLPFGRIIAARRYEWIPPAGRRRKIHLEIGTPVQVDTREWACPFRVSGLPKPVDTAGRGIDAVQALESALVGAGAALSKSPQFRAGQIVMWKEQMKNAAELSLPLPLRSIQNALDSLQTYLERQQEKERKTKRDWFDPEWRIALLSLLKEIDGNLATLAACLPVRRAVAGSKTSRKRIAKRGKNK